MAIESKATLKSYFETDDEPTEAQLANLIDSAANLSETDQSAGFVGDIKIKNPDHPMYGDIITGCTDFVDFLKRVFIPFEGLKVSINGNVVIEEGDPRSITISGTITVNDDVEILSAVVQSPAGGATIYSIPFPAPPLPATITYSYIDPNVSADKTYQVKIIVARDATSIIITSSIKNVYAVIPYLYGENVLQLDQTNIYGAAGISKLIQVQANSVQIAYSASLEYLHFAWPTAYGMISQIVDNNGFNQSFGPAGSGSDWEYITAVVNSGIWAEEMYILTQGPTSVNGTFTFNF